MALSSQELEPPPNPGRFTFTLWAVAAAYLAPVVLFSWRASDTNQDLIGTIPWLIFAILVAAVFWLFGSGRVFGGRVL
jgi:hypothetical protein